MASLEQQTEVVENQTFTQPFREKTTNVVQQPYVAARQAAYLLSNQEFRDLLTADNKLSAIISKFLTIAVGYAIIIFAKYIASLIHNQPSGIENWEPIAVVTAVVLLPILYFISDKFVPSKRKKLLERIEKFYDENPVSFEPYDRRKQ